MTNSRKIANDEWTNEGLQAVQDDGGRGTALSSSAIRRIERQQLAAAKRAGAVPYVPPPREE